MRTSHSLPAIGITMALLMAACGVQRSPVVEQANEMNSPVVLEGSVRRLGDAHVLYFRLSNRSNTELRIPLAELPWSGNAVMQNDRWPLRLELVRADGIHLAPARLLIDLGPPSVLTIKSGSSAEGSLRLETHFPELEAALENGPVDVRWSYALPDQSALLTGHVTMTK